MTRRELHRAADVLTEIDNIRYQISLIDETCTYHSPVITGLPNGKGFRPGSAVENLAVKNADLRGVYIKMLKHYEEELEALTAKLEEIRRDDPVLGDLVYQHDFHHLTWEKIAEITGYADPCHTYYPFIYKYVDRDPNYKKRRWRDGRLDTSTAEDAM